MQQHLNDQQQSEGEDEIDQLDEFYTPSDIASDDLMDENHYDFGHDSDNDNDHDLDDVVDEEYLPSRYQLAQNGVSQSHRNHTAMAGLSSTETPRSRSKSLAGSQVAKSKSGAKKAPKDRGRNTSKKRDSKSRGRSPSISDVEATTTPSTSPEPLEIPPNLPNPTKPDPDDPTTIALRHSETGTGFIRGELTLTAEDVIRFRTGRYRVGAEEQEFLDHIEAKRRAAEGNRGGNPGGGKEVTEEDKEKEKKEEKKRKRKRDMGMCMTEMAWRKLEEHGGIPKGKGWLCGGDNPLKPTEKDPKSFPYVLRLRLVIAASPRKAMTLSQIYIAFSHRWPMFELKNRQWQNSIRHVLSHSTCFKNHPRTADDGGVGKGAWWSVTEVAEERDEFRVKHKPTPKPIKPVKALKTNSKSSATPTTTTAQSRRSKSHSTSATPYPSQSPRSAPDVTRTTRNTSTHPPTSVTSVHYHVGETGQDRQGGEAGAGGRGGRRQLRSDGARRREEESLLARPREGERSSAMTSNYPVDDPSTTMPIVNRPSTEQQGVIPRVESSVSTTYPRMQTRSIQDQRESQTSQNSGQILVTTVDTLTCEPTSEGVSHGHGTGDSEEANQLAPSGGRGEFWDRGRRSGSGREGGSVERGEDDVQEIPTPTSKSPPRTYSQLHEVNLQNQTQSQTQPQPHGNSGPYQSSYPTITTGQTPHIRHQQQRQQEEYNRILQINNLPSLRDIGVNPVFHRQMAALQSQQRGYLPHPQRVDGHTTSDHAGSQTPLLAQSQSQTQTQNQTQLGQHLENEGGYPRPKLPAPPSERGMGSGLQVGSFGRPLSSHHQYQYQYRYQQHGQHQSQTQPHLQSQQQHHRPKSSGVDTTPLINHHPHPFSQRPVSQHAYQPSPHGAYTHNANANANNHTQNPTPPSTSTSTLIDTTNDTRKRGETNPSSEAEPSHKRRRSTQPISADGPPSLRENNLGHAHAQGQGQTTQHNNKNPEFQFYHLAHPTASPASHLGYDSAQQNHDQSRREVNRRRSSVLGSHNLGIRSSNPSQAYNPSPNVSYASEQHRTDPHDRSQSQSQRHSQNQGQSQSHSHSQSYPNLARPGTGRQPSDGISKGGEGASDWQSGVSRAHQHSPPGSQSHSQGQSRSQFYFNHSSVRALTDSHPVVASLPPSSSRSRDGSGEMRVGTSVSSEGRAISKSGTTKMNTEYTIMGSGYDVRQGGIREDGVRGW